jgi:hypothetical protein
VPAVNAVGELAPGTRIGGYVVDGLLGRGGMGVVYRAYHGRLRRWAAIKVLPGVGRKPEEVLRFEREAQAIASLRHPRILAVFDFGEYEGQAYMVTEFMPNGSLQERMPAGPLPVAEAVRLLRPLAEALDHAHAQGIVHRDVKPANVFLDERMQPVLADFGLARLQSQDSLTATGTVTGTPSYMAPEQARGGELSPATDLYALSVLAYQLVAGRLPFSGLSLMDTLYAHVHREPPPPSEANPELGPAVDAVLLRGLAKEPGERWPSAAALMDALERAAAEPAGGTTVRLPERLPEPRPGLGRRAAAWAGGAAVLIAALLLGGYQLARGAEARQLQVQPGSVAAGGTVLVQAGGLPPGTLVSVVLESERRQVGSGRSGRDGRVAVEARVPADLEPGRHLVRLCWDSSCPRQAALDVTSPASAATPAPTSQRYVRVEPPSPVRLGSTVQVSGRGLEPGSEGHVGVQQGGVVHPLSGGVQVAGDGSFSLTATVPGDLSPGPGVLLACNLDAAGRSDPARCLQEPVNLVR